MHGSTISKGTQFPRIVPANSQFQTQVLKREPKQVLLGLGALYIDGLLFNVLVVWSIPYLTNGKQRQTLPYYLLLGMSLTRKSLHQ